MTHYIVWNAGRSEGFVTTDQQLANSVRKGKSEECGEHWAAAAFAGQWGNPTGWLEMEVCK